MGMVLQRRCKGGRGHDPILFVAIIYVLSSGKCTKTVFGWAFTSNHAGELTMLPQIFLVGWEE